MAVTSGMQMMTHLSLNERLCMHDASSYRNTKKEYLFAILSPKTAKPYLQCGVLTRMKHYSRGSVRSCVQGGTEFPNPRTLEEAVTQVQGAITRALEDGKKRQLLQILLPTDQRQLNYLDTEPRDYPCSIREEFMTCSKMVSSILKGLGGEGTANKILTKRIGELDNEMDPVAVLYPSDKSIAAVIFPIAETLNKIKSLASSEEGRPLLIINPQWRLDGQVISDFGFGPWKRQADEFLETFEPSYVLLEQRIGEASNVISASGGVVRILRCYPSGWHIYLMAWDGTSNLIGLLPKKPSYKELEQLVTEARKTIPWLAPPRILGGSEPAPPPLPEPLSGSLSDEIIDQMEKIELRRALLAFNLPTSGKLDILRDRLKDAQKKVAS